MHLERARGRPVYTFCRCSAFLLHRNGELATLKAQTFAEDSKQQWWIAELCSLTSLLWLLSQMQMCCGHRSHMVIRACFIACLRYCRLVCLNSLLRSKGSYAQVPLRLFMSLSAPMVPHYAANYWPGIQSRALSCESPHEDAKERTFCF